MKETSYDKAPLTAAIRQIRKQTNIVVRQNYACCGSCGHYGFQADYKEGKFKPTKTGYLFYHAQDKDSMHEDGDCYLGFADFGPGLTVSPEFLAELAQVVQIFQENGLQPDWDGTENTRIMVSLPLKA